MQTFRKLSSKKGKFDGIQLGEVVSRNKQDSPNKNSTTIHTNKEPIIQHNISHVITHTEPSHIIKHNKENINKRAEKVVTAIQKRYDNNKKITPKEPDIQSPIISIKLVKNDNPRIERRVTPIKPKLASPTNKVVSFENKQVSQIKPKLISPVPNKSVLKRKTSPTISKTIASSINKVPYGSINKIHSHSKLSSVKNKYNSQKNNEKSVPIKYNTFEVRTLLSNYEYPTKPYINDNRYRTYIQYYNIYDNMRSFIDRFILANLSRGIKLI
jgi:hypothetical protein